MTRREIGSVGLGAFALGAFGRTVRLLPRLTTGRSTLAVLQPLRAFRVRIHLGKAFLKRVSRQRNVLHKRFTITNKIKLFSKFR